MIESKTMIAGTSHFINAHSPIKQLIVGRHDTIIRLGKNQRKEYDLGVHIVTTVPHIGKTDAINAVDEWRVETFCDRSAAREVVAAIRQAHPYEEPVVYVLPLLDEL